MNTKQLQAEVIRLNAENAVLKAKKTPSLSMKVSAKGGVSVYGLGRFPVTLYREQWERLLAIAEDIASFLIDHESELSSKDNPVVEQASKQTARQAKAIAELMAEDGESLSKSDVLAMLAAQAEG